MTWPDVMPSLRPPSCWRVEVMNGAFGEERYGFSSNDATVNGEPGSAATSRAPRRHDSRAPRPAAGTPQRAAEAGIGGEGGLQVPVVGGHEGHALALPLHHQPYGRALHAPGRQTRGGPGAR